jgi:hypothetical protein
VAEENDARSGVEAAFAACLGVVEEFIEAEDIACVLLELDRALADLLISCTLEARPRAPETEAVVVEGLANAVFGSATE